MRYQLRSVSSTTCVALSFRDQIGDMVKFECSSKQKLKINEIWSPKTGATNRRAKFRRAPGKGRVACSQTPRRPPDWSRLCAR